MKYVLAIAYNLLTLLILPFLPFVVLVRRVKGKKTLGDWRARCGLLAISNTEQRPVWFHAVSVGEVLSVQNLINQFEASGQPVYLTVGTLSGFRIANEKIACTRISLAPYDLLPFQLCAFKRIQPKKIIVVESELWPNMLLLAQLRSVPTYLINARVPALSLPRYQRFSFLYRTIFNLFTAIYTQSVRHTSLFKKLGVSVPLISAGNIKAATFVKKISTQRYRKKKEKKYTTLLLGSVHPDEFDAYLQLFTQLHSDHKLRMLIVPRHFHWKYSLVTQLMTLRTPFVVWDDQGVSECTSGNWKYEDSHSKDFLVAEHLETAAFAKKLLDSYQIVVVCTLGKLFDLYQLADIYYLGGTFNTVQGHNILEPCVWGVATIVGPHHANCKDTLDDLLTRDAVFVAHNQDELESLTHHLIVDEEQRRAAGRKAAKWVRENATSVDAAYLELLK